MGVIVVAMVFTMVTAWVKTIAKAMVMTGLGVSARHDLGKWETPGRETTNQDWVNSERTGARVQSTHKLKNVRAHS